MRGRAAAALIISVVALALVGTWFSAGSGDAPDPAAVTTAGGAGSRLTLGLADEVFLSGGDDGDVWLERARAAGARIVRLGVSWADVEPSQGTFVWDKVDEAVRTASRHDLEVLLSVASAPRWAEGPRRPADAPVGSWQPDSGALGEFAAAVAQRYSGDTPDLPRVRLWQAWNEPNLARFLSPQWVRGADGWDPASPTLYRRLYAAFAAGVKAAHADNVVVSGGMAPFGDPSDGGRRMAPVRFLTELLGGDRLSLDALDHHPYAVGPPEQRARNPDDASIADIAKLRGVLDRAGYVKTRLWVTELAYDSAPPDPDGIPEARRATWLVRALRILSRSGVDTVLWYTARDHAPDPQTGYAGSYQSGLYFADGRPKRALEAFRFPFTAAGGEGWAVAPVDGTMVVEQQLRDGWRTVARVRATAGRTAQFTGLPNVTAGAMRARIGPMTSLPVS